MRVSSALRFRCAVEQGDILYSAVGSYGVAVSVNTNQPFSFQRHIAHIKPDLLLWQPYLVHCLNSPLCLSQAHKVARGVAQKTVTLGDLANFVVPLPPRAEQEQIVAEVERRLSVISALEATVEASLKRAERLRQSVLREAFAGRLVPQDPTDEPASALLERIRAEREERMPGANRPAPRGRREQRKSGSALAAAMATEDLPLNGAVKHIDGAAARQLALITDVPEGADHSPRRGRPQR